MDDSSVQIARLNAQLLERFANLLDPDYRLGELLGVGSTGSVYSGVRRSCNRPVAIKLQPMLGSHAKGREAQQLARLKSCVRIVHPNVVRTEEIRVDPRDAFYAVVMERVPGPTFREFLFSQAHATTIGGLIDVLFQIAAGIDELHANGIIHRDIKPDNLFLVLPERRAKVGDFGIAVRSEEIRVSGSVDAWGSPAYVAPEQIIGTFFGPRVDIYSFAMTLYVLTTRCVPYEVQSARELLYAQVDRTPIPLRRRNRAWPVRLDAAVMRSLSKDPSERHATATDLMDEVAGSLAAYTPLRLSSYFDGSLSQLSSGEIPINF